jgi:hypothetical protein
MIAAVLLMAGPAWAQSAPSPADDPIGALLQGVSPAPAPDAPVTTAPPVPQAPVQTPPAPQPSYAPPTEQAGPRPYSPPPPISYARPPRPAAGDPVHIDELGKTPDGPPTPTDLNYEARIRGSFASAQGMQGPLDGRWVLRTGDGTALYELQLVDKNNGVLEGAWRDPRRRGAADSSGFVDVISRTGGAVAARFQIRANGQQASLSLTAQADGAWAGELTEGGERRSVSMRRD